LKGKTVKVTFKEWWKLIQNNFEKSFWINPEPLPDEYRPDLINKRGIYKDSFKASQPWADFQLRPNVPIAMAVVGILFCSVKYFCCTHSELVGFDTCITRIVY